LDDYGIIRKEETAYNNDNRAQISSESSSDSEDEEANSSNSVIEREIEDVDNYKVSKLKRMYENNTNKSEDYNYTGLTKNNIRKAVSMNNLGSGQTREWSSNSQMFSNYPKANDNMNIPNRMNGYTHGNLHNESRQSLSSNESSENETYSHANKENEVIQSNDDEKSRKSSVKHLANRFSKDSVDDSIEIGQVENDELSHIPEDLRQFFIGSPQHNSEQNVQDYAESFRAGSTYGEISGMVSQFNEEKKSMKEDASVYHRGYGHEIQSKTESENNSPNRVPENLIRMFDQPADHLAKSNSQNHDERKSSKVSEMAQVHERNSNTNLSDESSESDNDYDDHGQSDHVTVTYDEQKAVNFEEFEYGGGTVETSEDQDFIDNETLLSGVSFSDKESHHEEHDSSDSEAESRIFRENEFQYTKNPKFLLVKNLKNQFERKN